MSIVSSSFKEVNSHANGRLIVLPSSIPEAPPLKVGMTGRTGSGTAHAPAPSSLEATAESKYLLPQAWAELFEPYPWDWFFTLTFKDATHPESAGKIFDTLIHQVNRDAYGQYYWKDKSKGVFWARGTEWQRRGVIHYHALVGGIPDFVRMSKYQYWWQERVAKQCSFERYDGSRGGRYYMAKSAYTFKRGEIDFSGTLVMERDGVRTCAKSLHDGFCGQYVEEGKIHARLSSYLW